MKKNILLVALGLCIGTMTAIAQTMRLSAVHESYYFTSQGGWTPFDSVQFVYSSNNGGTSDNYDANQLKADTSFYRAYIAGTYVPDKMVVKTFDIQGQITGEVDYEYVNPDYEPFIRYTYSFDANINAVEDLTETYNGNSWVNSNKTSRTFDMNNNLTSSLRENWYNGNWENSQQRIYNYDVSDNMITYKLLLWNTGTNTWDSNHYQHNYYTGNLRDSVYFHNWQPGWAAYQRYYLNYDVNDDNNHRLYQSWDAGTLSWENTLQSFITHNNHYVVSDSTMYWEETTGNWENYYKYRYHYNADWNVLSLYYQDWDPTNSVFVNSTLDSNEYNGLYRTSRRDYTWDSNSNNFDAADNDAIARYYYETFTANVNAVFHSAGELNIYPIPARNSLNVDMKWSKAQDFKLAIYDLQGRLVSQTGEKATSHFSKSIPLHGLAAGTYILSIRGKDVSVRKEFIIANE